MLEKKRTTANFSQQGIKKEAKKSAAKEKGGKEKGKRKMRREWDEGGAKKRGRERERERERERDQKWPPFLMLLIPNSERKEGKKRCR